jgi:Ca-activated chloride channel homolog
MALAAGCAIGASAQQPTFSSKVEAVRVDVLVTRNGQPVTGLRPVDFEVLDNGVRQEVAIATFEQIPLNVVLALDMSESVTGDRLEHLRHAGGRLLDALARDDQVALLMFSHAVVQSAPLTRDVERVRQALVQTVPSGLTALVDATFTGMMVGESDAGRGLLIVFSDGVDTSSWLSADTVVQTAKRSDVVVYTVSAGAPRETEFLEDIAEQSGGRWLRVESAKDLGSVFVSVLQEFRQRYLVSYSPRAVSSDGWHRLEVRVRGRGLTVKARPGYLAGTQ